MCGFSTYFDFIYGTIYYLTFDCCYVRCEISEGRVTNCVLSTLSAVRIVVVLFNYCCCFTIRIRVRTWRLWSRFSFLFSIYFALLQPKLICILYFILFYIFSWGHDCTLKWNWKTTTKRSETIRYETIHAFYEWNRHNVIFLYSRDFALYAHGI